MTRIFHRGLVLGLVLAIAASTAGAAPATQARGQVTNLPLPRFVSLKTSEGNVRRGPSLSHRIDWVYRRKDLPLKIVAEYGHWRRVQDRDGLGGWVHYSLLSGARTAIVEAEAAAMRMSPTDTAPENARAMRGVVARIARCSRDWCQMRAGDHRGWVRKSDLWGVGREEVFD